MKVTNSTIADYNKAQEAIQKFESDNYGYQLTDKQQKQADKLQEKYEDIILRLSEDDAYYLGLDYESIHSN